MTITCLPEEVVVEVINELHDVAEIVRTYGDLGRTPGSGQPNLGATPTQLYLTAAAIEASCAA